MPIPMPSFIAITISNVASIVTERNLIKVSLQVSLIQLVMGAEQYAVDILKLLNRIRICTTYCVDEFATVFFVVLIR